MLLSRQFGSTMAKRKSNGGGGLLMILSPAKTLDLSPIDSLSFELTTPDCDSDKTKQVAGIIKKKKKIQLPKVLGISPKLAETAFEYWSAYRDDPRDRDDVKPAIFSFSGAAYQGLQSSSCSENAIHYMQENLRIIDPLYGILRPLDMMQPYRLEMACKGVFPDDKKLKLADFWKPSVTERINQDLAGRSEKILLNLASDEYSAAVNVDELPEGAEFVKVVFWQEGRTIALHAKRARGLMVRFLAENQVETLDDLKDFAEEGYTFQPDASSELSIVFDRPKQVANDTAAPSRKASEKQEDKRPKRRRTKR